MCDFVVTHSRQRKKQFDFINIIVNWKFTKSTNNKLLATLFDMTAHDSTLRAPFNRRSWVTKWSKIFKKLQECYNLTKKYNLEILLETKSFSRG